MNSDHCQKYMEEAANIAGTLELWCDTEVMVQQLVKLRERKGRLFFLGLGGSGANCSHACNDMRKLCGIESYAPTDNVAELTAWANDEGWAFAFASPFKFITKNDAIFILSVGGGSLDVSMPICTALMSAKKVGIQIFGIVGRDGGKTKELGDCVIVVPTVAPERVTPHTEAFQSVLLHCIVSHPDLQITPTKW